MERVIKEFVENRRGEELPYFLDVIIQGVCDLDSAIYLNAGGNVAFYNEFEKWAIDYAIINNKKELEKYDREYHSQENKEKISILQMYLEKFNYKNKRVLERYDNNSRCSTEIVFKKWHYEEGGLAISVFTSNGERIADLAKRFYPSNSDEFDYKNNAILLDGYSCPEKIIIYMFENKYIQTLGKGRQIDGKVYPIALVNGEWLSSIEEMG